MILIIVWDGLRPDMVTPDRTPFVARMAEEGVFCRRSHAVFPTATRINSAALSTGCYPAKHGIPDNELYVPALEPTKTVSCADWRFLQRMADLEGGRLLGVPTLGEILQDHGRRMASGGSGSPGTTYLTNPTVTGPIVNWALAWPEEAQERLTRRYGGMLGVESTASQRNRFVVHALQEVIIPAVRPDVLVLWLTEPDHTQHARGLASSETLATLREVDAITESLVSSLAADPICAPLTCFLLSDHGFSTVAKHVDPDGDLQAAGFGVPNIVRASNSLFLGEATRDRIDKLLRFLASRHWIGALFLRDDLLQECPGAMPQSAVYSQHRRAAEVMFSYRWWDAPNEHGVPGAVCYPGSYLGIHGSASPYALNNTLIAWGEGIKRGVTSDVPCGIVDVAPTVLHLLGIKAPADMDGRVLHELLSDGPHPVSLTATTDQTLAHYESQDGIRCQAAYYSEVADRRYLDRVEWQRDRDG